MTARRIRKAAIELLMAPNGVVKNGSEIYFPRMMDTALERNNRLKGLLVSLMNSNDPDRVQQIIKKASTSIVATEIR